MTRDLTEAEVDSLNQEMEDTLTSFHFKDLPTWLTKNIHEAEETTTKSGDACWFAFKTYTQKLNSEKNEALWELPRKKIPLFLSPPVHFYNVQKHTVRNLHFLSKNSTLIFREKLVKMLWFWTF